MILNIYLLIVAFSDSHCMCFLLSIGPSFWFYYTLPPYLLFSLLWYHHSHLPSSCSWSCVGRHLIEILAFPPLLQLSVKFTYGIFPAFQFRLMPLRVELPIAHMERLNTSYSRNRAVNPECLCCWGKFFASQPRPLLSTSLEVVCVSKSLVSFRPILKVSWSV